MDKIELPRNAKDSEVIPSITGTMLIDTNNNDDVNNSTATNNKTDYTVKKRCQKDLCNIQTESYLAKNHLQGGTDCVTTMMNTADPSAFKRKRRRLAEIDEHELWRCPFTLCNKVYSSKSTASIQQHRRNCVFKGLQERLTAQNNLFSPALTTAVCMQPDSNTHACQHQYQHQYQLQQQQQRSLPQFMSVPMYFSNMHEKVSLPVDSDPLPFTSASSTNAWTPTTVFGHQHPLISQQPSHQIAYPMQLPFHAPSINMPLHMSIHPQFVQEFMPLLTTTSTLQVPFSPVLNYPHMQAAGG